MKNSKQHNITVITAGNFEIMDTCIDYEVHVLASDFVATINNSLAFSLSD